MQRKENGYGMMEQLSSYMYISLYMFMNMNTYSHVVLEQISVLIIGIQVNLMILGIMRIVFMYGLMIMGLCMAMT